MKFSVCLLTILTALSLAPLAHAEELLFDDACAVPSDSSSAAMFTVLAAGSAPMSSGLTCQDLKSYGEAVSLVRAAIMPATTAFLLAPGAKDLLIADLAGLGLTFANPAVLGVTVLGAAGVSVIYIVLQKKLADCEAMEKEQLKEQIVEELARKYGLHAAPDFRLDVNQ